MKKQDRAFIYESNQRKKYGYTQYSTAEVAIGIAILSALFFLMWARLCIN